MASGYKVGKALATIGTFAEVHSTTAQNPLMTVVEDELGGQYIYMAGATSVGVGTLVTYDELGVVTLIAANAIGPVAIAMAAIDATTKFGWYCVKSPKAGVTAKTDSGITDNAAVYIDGTSGRCDDTVVAGDLIANAFFRSTDSSNLSTVQINHPFVTDTLS